MPLRHRVARRLFVLAWIVLAAAPAAVVAQEYPHNAVVSKDVWMELSIYGGFHGTIPLTGIGVLEWSDPVPEGPLLVTRMRWMQFDLSGSIMGGPIKDLFVNLSPMPQSLGEATGLLPGEWCPAESFFDIYPMVMAEGQRIYNPQLPPAVKGPTGPTAEQGTAQAMDTSGPWGKPNG